jgi:polyisoprenoid-binding protein YceI
MSGAYRNQALAALFLALLALAGCAGRPARQPALPASVAPSTEAGARREGQAYQVAPADSLLTVLVYRGGALARAGHNHVIASHSLTGTVWVPADPQAASFEIHVPVNDFTIDEPALRAQEGADFSTEVPDSARDGTKKNMLSEPMLDGARYPEVVLRSERLEIGSEGILAQVSVTIRGQTRTVTVPVRYEMHENEVRAQGQLTLKQTDLGLTPFSLLGGALRVEDAMTVRFSLLARGE